MALGICKNWSRGHEAASHYTYLSDTRLQYFLYSPHRSQHKNIIYMTTLTHIDKRHYKICHFLHQMLKNFIAANKSGGFIWSLETWYVQHLMFVIYEKRRMQFWGGDELISNRGVEHGRGSWLAISGPAVCRIKNIDFRLHSQTNSTRPAGEC